MIQDILVPFLMIGLAELGDKTQVAIFLLASKIKKHSHLLIGAILAFILADGLAIVLGNALRDVIPIVYIKIGSGILFIIFGIITLVNIESENKIRKITNPFLTSFSLVFVSELGDKTQIASGLFATQYKPLLVFIGVIAALAILSIIAIYVGRIVMRKVNKRLISIIAGLLFILLGIVQFLSI